MLKIKKTNKYSINNLKNWFIIVIIISLISLFIVFLTEFYLKFIGLGQTPSYDKNFMYGYSLKPNQSLERLNNIKVNINSIGVRSSEEKNDNDKIIAFIGDSVTYGGSYIDNSKIFSQKVCDILKKKNKIYFCANAGVNAYSIINMVYRVRYDNRLDADFYIFLVITGDFLREYRNSDTAHFYLNRNETLFPAISEAINFMLTKYDLKKKFGKKMINNLEENNRLKKSEEHLVNFNINLINEEIERLQKNNKKIEVLYWPDKYKDENKKNIEKTILKNVRGIKNLEDFGEIHDRFYYDGVHLSEDGHEYLSQIISSIIIK